MKKMAEKINALEREAAAKEMKEKDESMSVIHLHEGISALQWAGLEQKKLPKACMPEVKLSEFVTLVELSEL